MKLSKNRPVFPKLSGYHSTEGEDFPLFFYLVGMGMWWLSTKEGEPKGRGGFFSYFFFGGGLLLLMVGRINNYRQD